MRHRAQVRFANSGFPSLSHRVVVCLSLALWCAASQLAWPPGIEIAWARESAQATAAARDWDKYPAIVEVDTDHAVYALGDVHGDYDRLVRLLAAAGLTPEVPDKPSEVRWNADRAVLVCTGDLIDKWHQSVNVLALFQALQAAAEKKGGRVIVTMGNHEADFLADPDSDKVADFAEDLHDEGIKPKDVAAGRDAVGLGKFLRSLPLAARVNDWFFAHAGNTRGRTVTQLRSELQEGVDAHSYRSDEVVAPLGALLNARLHPYPWWQESEHEDKNASKRRLSTWVNALGVKHLVVGHQNGKVNFSDGSRRERGEVFEKFDGLVFLIDVGMSRGIGRSKGAILHIHKEGNARATVILADGSEKKLWPE
jgi:hypothetical protein